MRLTSMLRGLWMLLPVCLVLGMPVQARADDDGGGWVEQPRELPVQADAAERTAAFAAQGGAGTSVPLLLGGVALEWLAATHGLALAAWVDAQSPSPTGTVVARGTRAARISQVTAVGLAVAGAAAGVAFTSGAVLLSVVAAAWLVPMYLPVVLPIFLAGASLMGLGAVVLGTALSASLASLLGLAAGNAAFHAMWPRDGARDASVSTEPRPLKPEAMRTLLSHVALGALQENRWAEHLPLFGPWVAASRSHVRVTQALVDAREIAGMPRVRDTLQQWSDALLYGRAALLTVAWIQVPLVVMGLVGAGALLVAGAVQAGPMVLALVGGAVALSAFSVVAGAVMVGSAVAAQVLWSLTPGLLARRAAGPAEDLPVDEKLRAQRRRIRGPPRLSRR